MVRMRWRSSAYLLALVVTATAVAVRWWLDPWLGDRLSVVTLFAAVAACTWFGGTRPALLAAVLGYLACNVLFIQPRGGFGFESVGDVIGLVAFLVSCGVVVGFGHALRAARRKAKDDRDLLRITLASIGDAVLTTDVEGRVTSLNAAAEALTGWNAEEAAARPLPAVFRILDEETRRPAENPALRALAGGVVIGLANHTVLVAEDGSELPIDYSAAPIVDDEGRIAGCVLVFRGIAERRRAERSEERYRSLVGLLPVAVYTCDAPSGLITFYNEHAALLWGRAPALVDTDQRFCGSLRLWRPDGSLLPHAETPMALALREGRSFRNEEVVIERPDGSRITVLVNIDPVRDGAGRVTGAINSFHDTTQLERARDALRRSEERYRSLVSVITDVPWTTDADGAFATPLPAWIRYTGQTWEEARGFGWADAIHPDDREGIQAAWASACASRTLYEGRCRLRHAPTGEYRHVVARATPLLDSNGDVREWVGSCTDVHEQTLAKESLLEADHKKDEFLATLAHELRNPLAPVRNSLEIMKRVPESRELVEQARSTLERGVALMERLIDDLMDVSRITRNRLELRKHRIELASAVHHAAETCRPLAEACGHDLRVTLPPGPIILDGDAVRLAQVFSNLLNNACKYTEAGGSVRLTAERRADEVIVTVADDGIGIPPEMLPRVFDMFTQVDPTLERSHGGLGIGLTLVKQLVELHGGRVEARSAGAGRGSEFVVTLPILAEEPEPERPRASSNGPARKLRVLVVDDNRDAAMTLSMLMKMTGNETRLAHDGVDAVEAAEAFRPDVVLLDIGLPKMNGYDVSRAIREKPWAEGVVIVALTGWGQDRDRRDSEDAGIDGHLVKPVDHAGLMEMLADLTR